MSILIKGIKMPKCCADCPCFYDFISCQALFDGTDDFSMSGFDEFKERLPNCPLVEVPTPHGRLIDADALYEQTAEWEAKALAQVEKHDPLVENQARGWAHWSVVLVERTAFKYDIADAPTIIEAEEGRG